MAVSLFPMAVVVTSVVITIVTLVIATGVAGIRHWVRGFWMIYWLFRHWITAVIVTRLRWVHCMPRIRRAGSGNVQHLPGVNYIRIPQAVCVSNALGLRIVSAANAVQCFTIIYFMVSALTTTPGGRCGVGSRYKY